MNDKEEWRPVVGHEDSHEISNVGRVRSKTRSVRVIRGNQDFMSILRSKILSPVVMKSGHLRVKVNNTAILVHRMVAEAFIGPQPPGKPLVLHWDDDPSNNNVSNLRWGDRRDNATDLYRNRTVRSYNAEKTHCINGHPFDETNTYTVPTTGRRQCVICRAAADKRRQKRRKGVKV